MRRKLGPIYLHIFALFRRIILASNPSVFLRGECPKGWLSSGANEVKEERGAIASKARRKKEEEKGEKEEKEKEEKEEEEMEEEEKEENEEKEVKEEKAGQLPVK